MNIYLAELIGTAILVYLGVGANASVNLKESYAYNSGWIIISLGWGLAVTLGVYAVGSISGAHLNPAVTVGLAMAGDFPWSKVSGYILSQIVGGIFGGIMVWLHYLPHWAKTEEAEVKLGVFCTSPAVPSTYANILSELLGTFTLVFAMMFIGANQFADGLNPLIIGGLIVIIGISLGGTTGYAINPARDLGPRIAHFILPISGKGKSDWGYSWIPVVGPLIGGVFGSLTYLTLFKAQISIAFWVTLGLVVGIIVMAVLEQKKDEK